MRPLVSALHLLTSVSLISPPQVSAKAFHKGFLLRGRPRPSPEVFSLFNVMLVSSKLSNMQAVHGSQSPPPSSPIESCHSMGWKIGTLNLPMSLPKVAWALQESPVGPNRLLDPSGLRRLPSWAMVKSLSRSHVASMSTGS